VTFKITRDDKHTQLGFFYLRPTYWEWGEVKCNVWWSPRLGIIVWNGADWHPYEDFHPHALIKVPGD